MPALHPWLLAACRQRCLDGLQGLGGAAQDAEDDESDWEEADSDVSDTEGDASGKVGMLFGSEHCMRTVRSPALDVYCGVYLGGTHNSVTSGRRFICPRLRTLWPRRLQKKQMTTTWKT
jgi:hypothetical protein